MLDHPERDFPSVHIAGTNGKGSVSNMVASILQEAGYNTGLFTSPHLKDFRERIRVNGTMVPEDFIVEFVEKHKAGFEPVGASFFEYTFAMAMQYFAEQKVDIVVVETGMGGRLDSTNVVTPVVTAITNIGMDHTAFLGNTLKKIAAEKAGIIKQEVPVVIGEMQEEVMDVFIEHATEQDAPLSFADNSFAACFNSSNRLDINKDGESYISNIRFPLGGWYQEKNVPATMEIVSVLKQEGYKITKKAMKSGLEHVMENTGFMGRWQILGREPLVVGDTGHNEDGISAVLKQLKAIPHEHLHIVLAMVNDKDITTILSLFPKDAMYYFSKADIPRGLDVHALHQEAEKHGLAGKEYGSIQEALMEAKAKAGKKDVIFVGGSTFTVAEVL